MTQSNFIQAHARTQTRSKREVLDSTPVQPSENGSLNQEQVLQETETQPNSSVIASRRLDEALLRLDRAAGRQRGSVARATSVLSVNEEMTQAPIAGSELSESQETTQDNVSAASQESPAHPIESATGLQLDDSVAQSSSMWLESTVDHQQFRLDPPEGQASSGSEASPAPAPHTRRSRKQPESDSPDVPNSLAAEATDEGTQVELDLTTEAVSVERTDLFESLFAGPIDVMVMSGVARVSAPELPVQTPAAEQPATPNVEAESQSVSTEVDETLLVDDDKEHDEPLTVNEVEAALAAQVSHPSNSQASAQTQVEQPSTEAVPKTDFAAAWQVEQLDIPETVEELFLQGSLADQLSERLAEANRNGLSSIAVTSLRKGEGRSTVSIGLALSVAFSGLKVALVDADADGPKLASDLQLEIDNGWIDALRAGMPLEEVAVASQDDAITLIPMLDRPGDHPPQIGEMRQMLNKLTQSFDLVIVDCAASATHQVALCDTALIVRDTQRTASTELETFALTLRRNGLHAVGVVENFC